jgi:hypothetical protein
MVRKEQKDMIKVLGYVTHQETCTNCEAILEFQKKDVEVGVDGFKYIECPVCKEHVLCFYTLDYS